MRMLLKARMPHAPLNAAIRDGSIGRKIQKILDAIKPEAVYFTEENGHRCAILIVEVADPSKIPVLAEPFFLLFQADVEFRIVMSPEELKHSDIDHIGKMWS
jgi:hypothetical protein